MDVIIDDNHVVMTDETGLCDRDPGSNQVMTHVAKAATLIVKFDLRSAAWPTLALPDRCRRRPGGLVW